MTKKPLPAWAVLAIITLVAALALGGTYEMTKGAIAQRKIEEDEATRTSILPTASSFEQQADADGLDAESFYIGKDPAGEISGYTGSK
ncbi:MAG: hypothetical protein IJ174_09625, partial [Clostridia bacterium]|nr:hypothetical protein [Clostridia bacterium]